MVKAIRSTEITWEGRKNFFCASIQEGKVLSRLVFVSPDPEDQNMLVLRYQGVTTSFIKAEGLFEAVLFIVCEAFNLPDKDADPSAAYINYICEHLLRQQKKAREALEVEEV